MKAIGVRNEQELRRALKRGYKRIAVLKTIQVTRSINLAGARLVMAGDGPLLHVAENPDAPIVIEGGDFRTMREPGYGSGNTCRNNTIDM